MSRNRVSAARIAASGLWLAGIIALLALGTWQVQRLAWKRALIAQVAARLAAPPVPAPAAAGPSDAYRRIYAIGSFEQTRDSFVQAVTVRGPGWWVLTPLRTTEARIILVDRGYVARRAAPPPPSGQVTVTGLLRLSEPGGGFLRRNDPAADRWFSRDIAAIAARHRLGATAPYFIDADATDTTPGAPVGGLTLVTFPNNHLVYAMTWYILAVMAAAGLIFWIRSGRERGTGPA